MAITDPTDIPDLVLWLAADSITGLSDGGTITASDLLDQSGNGNHPTSVTGSPVWESSTGSDGGAAIKWTFGTYATFGNIMSGLSAGEVMVTIKADSGNNGHWAFGGAPDLKHYPFAGTVYEDWGISSRTSFSPTVAVTSWRRYNIWTALNDWSARLDETTQATVTSQSAAFPSAPRVGNVWADGSVAPIRYGVMVVYGRKLTTTERSDLAAWMAANPSGGTAAPPAPSGSLAATLPAPTVALAGSYADPPLSGSFAASLPVPAVAFAGTYDGPLPPPAGALGVSLPVPTLAFAGGYAGPGGLITGALAATLPRPTLALVGVFYPRNGYGMVLDSTSTVDAEAPLPATPSDTGTPAISQHVITPTVPAPVLVNGRPS